MIEQIFHFNFITCFTIYPNFLKNNFFAGFLHFKQKKKNFNFIREFFSKEFHSKKKVVAKVRMNNDVNMDGRSNFFFLNPNKYAKLKIYAASISGDS